LGFLHAPKRLFSVLRAILLLSIPFTWDFSMHPQLEATINEIEQLKTFNSLYLGFLHAPNPFTGVSSHLLATIFQFPLLGISPCT